MRDREPGTAPTGTVVVDVMDSKVVMSFRDGSNKPVQVPLEPLSAFILADTLMGAFRQAMELGPRDYEREDR